MALPQNAHRLPRYQSAIIALTLANRSLDAVLRFYEAADGPPFDALSEFLDFAFDSLKNCRCLISSITMAFDEDVALEAFIADQPTPSASAYRRAELERLLPLGPTAA